MILEKFAEKWDLPAEAMEELKMLFGFTCPAATSLLHNENDVRNKTRLVASAQGGYLWRNNVGATYTNSGQFLRYGLCNDSKAINQKFKSSDLIGIKPIKITGDMLGMTIGQFQSIEVKKPTWKFRSTADEMAQFNWLRLIITLGGSAKFTTTGEI